MSTTTTTTAKTRTLDLDGLKIACDETGSGDQALVLIHGLTGHRKDFEIVLPELAINGRTLAPDLRGHGASSRDGSSEHYRMDTMVEDLRKFLDALDLERCDLLGHSFGGMLALRFALEYPDRLNSLVLMSTSSEAPDNLTAEVFNKAGKYARDAGMEVFQAKMEEVGTRTDEPLPEDATAEQRAWRDLYWSHHRLRHLEMDPIAYEALGLEMMQQIPVTNRLAEIECPTSVIIGNRDADFVRGAELLAKGLRDPTVYMFDGIDHQPHQEAKTEFLAVMAEHLRRVRE